MTRNLLPIAALAALVACGDGAPFGTPPVTDPDPSAPTEPTPDPDPDPGADPGAEGGGIPDVIASTVTGFTYNPGAGTMTLSGTLRDGDALTTTFTRNAALDVLDANSGAVAYEAFTAQDDPLDEHTTVYARAVGDVSAAVAVTGGQFTYYSGGVSYTRTGGFDPGPIDEAQDTGLVTYAGQYAGLTNLNGPRTDLLAPPAGVSDSTIIPAQAGPVSGRVFINVSFADNQLAGEIYNRQVDSEAFGTFNVSDLILVPTELAADGTFSGEVELPSVRTDVGEYGGLIGGNAGEAMAGGIYVDEHFDELIDPATGNPITRPDGTQVVISGEEEFGIFVLGRCGSGLEDPSAECAPPVDPQ